MDKLEKFLQRHEYLTYIVFWIVVVITWQIVGFEQAVTALLAGNIYEIYKLGRKIDAHGKGQRTTILRPTGS